LTSSLAFALTDHVEGPREKSSSEVYEEVAELVCLADALGVEYAWFSEHHAHAHFGHLPTPLLYALHLAGRTEHILLGTAIVCLNLHHPLAIAESVAVADVLIGGRISPGFGSGSTPEEFGYFGLEVTEAEERHERFAEALKVVLAAWRGEVGPAENRYVKVPAHGPLPVARPDLHVRSWLAVNSVGSAAIAGRLGFNMMFSHLRTPEQYRTYLDTYRAEGGSGLVAANRPVYVGVDDATAWREVEPALRTLWRRFRTEGKIAADTIELDDPRSLCGHPINFMVGGPDSVATQIEALRLEVPFDVMNVELRWEGLSHARVCQSLRLLAEQVRPRLPYLPSPLRGGLGRGA
jgi:alkanesulfonate monooxygenase SsuD/methylene tetrahydromethanopterin reductase-like flavin-dependent oxidoreductase (luciferase family)